MNNNYAKRIDGRTEIPLNSPEQESKFNNYIANLERNNLCIKEAGNSLSLTHSNVNASKSWFSFNKRMQWQNMLDREIITHLPDQEIGQNKISTSKYTFLSFIPKNLYEQFSKLANLYFLFIGIMQIIRAISISNGQPVIYMPLGVILAITAIKDFFEDQKRHKSDNEENKRKVSVIRNGDLIETFWADVLVGEIIKVNEDEFLPADVLLVMSSEKKGICYIETKNLDGETNLKRKSSNLKIMDIFDRNENNLLALDKKFKLSYEKPNPYLYTFTGTAIFENGEKVSCDNQNFILRGCSLRNTKYIYGLVCYNGHDTKIMLNSVRARAKKSKMELIMNRQIIIVFILQLFLCMFGSLFYSVSYSKRKNELIYLEIDLTGSVDNSFVYNFFIRIGNWILIFTNFVPISLLVTLEMVKFIQGILISKDKDMKSCDNEYVNVQSSNLNEELGQVEYIFSDKTGTLTCNIMEFRKISINGISYGNDHSYDTKNLPKVTNVNFSDILLFSALENESNANFQIINKTLLLLSLCHTVILESKNEENIYNASSPDELALINFAKMVGYEFFGVDDSNRMMVKVKGKIELFELLQVLEFSSNRKRMSVIIKNNKDEIFLYTKGADSILLERMNKTNLLVIEETWHHLEKYAEKGLRTLALCERKLTKEEYKTWAAKYQEAITAIENREKKMEEAQELIEKDLILIGATAIEDRLQDDVARTIAILKEAGIKVWVLTGDKIETAINIAYSCSLLTNELDQVIIDSKEESDIIKKIEDTIRNISSQTKYALVLSGDTLIKALKPEISEKLLKLAGYCEAVLCCRVSPKQKQEVVSLVRRGNPLLTTLAIGDGANDVNMITAAHVGIGIKGKEGSQASRASDYALGEFKFLRRLLFFHGREAYRRNSILICYNFFKNVILVLPQFWFGFFDIFSGQTLYDSYLYQLFNLFYAAMPIIIFAVFDQQYKPDFLDKCSMTYQQGMKGLLFNKKIFWQWFFNGVWQALIISIFIYQILCFSFVNNNGYTLGFWPAGITCFGACVLISNIKVALFSNTFTVLSAFFLIGSVVIYISSFAIVNKMGGLSEIHLDFDKLHKVGGYYLSYLLIIVFTSGADLALSRYNRFKVSVKNKPKISKLFIENKKNITVKIEKINKNDVSNPIIEEEMQGQGIQVVPVNKKRNVMKKSRYAFSQEDLKEELEKQNHVF